MQAAGSPKDWHSRDDRRQPLHASQNKLSIPLASPHILASTASTLWRRRFVLGYAYCKNSTPHRVFPLNTTIYRATILAPSNVSLHHVFHSSPMLAPILTAICKNSVRSQSMFTRLRPHLMQCNLNGTLTYLEICDFVRRHRRMHGTSHKLQLCSEIPR
jgi:hypothetical protein